MCLHRTPFCCATICYAPSGACCYRCPKRLHVDIVALYPLVTMGIVLR